MIPRTAEFFAFARERHATYLRRRAGVTPWTSDPILQAWRFTNVFRELDAVTVWFRENVRDPLHNKPEVLLATVLFRWFNRVTTGEAIFKQKALGFGGEQPGETAWDALLRLPDLGEGIGAVQAAILQYSSPGPYVTGAYIVKTPDGMDKVEGVLWCVEQFMLQQHAVDDFPVGGWRGTGEELLKMRGQTGLQNVWSWLRRFPYMGDFMAYEVVTDLRHTALLDQAPDIMTWANPGPGAARGLGRVFAGDPEAYNKNQKQRLNELMHVLLEVSRDAAFWPHHDGIDGWAVPSDMMGDAAVGNVVDWPAWEMRDVEHTLCEFDKYERIREGGRGKRRYP